MSDLCIYAGTTVTISFAVTSGGDAYDLTGASLSFVANDGSKSITKTSGAGQITISSPSGGTGSIAVTSSDTLNWASVQLPWAFTVTTAGGSVYMVDNGILHVNQPVPALAG